MAGAEITLDGATVAFRRLLAETAVDAQARVDALLALTQRQVWVVDWPGSAGARTLTNEHRESALPVFTAKDVLEDAAQRLGWTAPGTDLPVRKLPARDALRHALAKGVHFLVIDLGAPHTMEFTSAEIEPLLSVSTAALGSGPYLGDRDSEASLWTAVRRSSFPPAGGRGSFLPPAGPPAALNGGREAVRGAGGPKGERSADSTGVHATQPGWPEGISPLGVPAEWTRGGTLDALDAQVATPDPSKVAELPEDVHTKQTVVGDPAPADLEASGLPADLEASGLVEKPAPGPANTQNSEPISGEHLSILAAEQAQAGATSKTIEGEVLDRIAGALRAFPEVEWASAVVRAEGGHCIGVRVDPAFMNRVTQISGAVANVAAGFDMEVLVTILQSRSDVQLAQHDWQAFYPWRKRAATD